MFSHAEVSLSGKSKHNFNSLVAKYSYYLLISKISRFLKIAFRYVEQIYYLEGYFGRRADLNICVTHAMRQDMFDAWEISAATVYDRPPAWNFRKLTDEERHKFLLKLIDYGEEFEIFKAINNPSLQRDCIFLEGYF